MKKDAPLLAESVGALGVYLQRILAGCERRLLRRQVRAALVDIKVQDLDPRFRQRLMNGAVAAGHVRSVPVRIDGELKLAPRLVPLSVLPGQHRCREMRVA